VAKMPKRTTEEKERSRRNLERMYRLLEERVKEDERIAAARASRAGKKR
jgi:hypothetical protein